MRCTFFIGLYLLSAVYKSAYAFTPTECLQQLTKLGEKKTIFTGRDNVYCSYIRKDSINKASFDIKDSNIEDWDVIIGQWDKKNLSVDSSSKPSVTKENNKYNISINADNINAIVWVSNSGNNGKIDNVKLNKKFAKREDTSSCEAFKNGTFLWKDISWDNSNEKYIGTDLINLNNTAYLDTLALKFRKSNDKGKNNYFTNDFLIAFKIKSDTDNWMVYCGEYDEKTKEVSICHEWNLSEEERKGELSVSTDATYQLSPPDDSTCHNNIIWWQNIKNDQNSQRIWLSSLTVQNCENDDDEDEEEEGDDDDGDDE